MAIGLSVVTGAAISGLTSPTYTMTVDINTGNEKSWVVTGLGGTQTGVLTHSSSNPFSLKVRKALSVKPLPRILPNGFFKSGGKNKFNISLLKGVLTLAGQPQEIEMFSMDLNVPAGADLADSANLKAALSLWGGFFNAQADGLFALVSTNTI